MRRSKFSGVYSFSADWTDSRRKAYYFVWELPDDAFAVQELNAAFQPVSEVERISAKAFSGNFHPEPSILAMPVVTPDLSHFETAAAAKAGDAPEDAPTRQADAEESAQSPSGQELPAPKAPRVKAAVPEPPFKEPPHRKKLPDSVDVAPAAQGGKLPVRTATGVTAVKFSEAPAATAAAQPRKAYDLEAVRKAKVVESKLRETFRQTLLRLKRPRERKAAMLALEQLAKTTDGITPSHKHMFRDFGVRLRQNSQPDLALLFSRKAVELSPEDDHAHFNLARILCALGKYDEAAVHISAALRVAGDDPLYSKLLAHIHELKQKRVASRSTRSN